MAPLAPRLLSSINSRLRFDAIFYLVVAVELVGKRGWESPTIEIRQTHEIEVVKERSRLLGRIQTTHHFNFRSSGSAGGGLRF